MANDVMGLLDYLKLEKIILAGLSMGGYVALEFYNLYPEKLRALVLADTKAAADTEEARQKRSVSAEKVVREGMQSIVDDMLPKVFAPITSEKQPEIVENVKQMMLSTTPEGTAAGLRGMAERNDHTALLEKIKVPTLIIVGEEDQLTPPEEAEKMHRIIRNSQLAGIANAGHLSPNEQTEEFNNALIKFLKTIEA
jgi:pimeloyl-ACP methyl ester carboxylesterase